MYPRSLHDALPICLASGPSHRRTRRIPVVEVADELHVRGPGSDQDELKGARLALRGSGRGGGHPVEEEADRKGGSRYEAAERDRKSTRLNSSHRCTLVPYTTLFRSASRPVRRIGVRVASQSLKSPTSSTCVARGATRTN